MKKTVILSAPAKLNLYLDVKGTRSDGYHNIETVMQSIELCDKVTVTADTENHSGNISVSCNDPLIPQNEKNICYKAAEEFLNYCGSDGFEINISIEKNIPAGAGLAGGSADAAAVIAALNNICRSGMDSEELCNIAARTGSDVPFCLTGGTAYCTGRGDIIRRLKNLPTCVFAVGMGKEKVSTAKAYEGIDEAKPIALKNAAAVFSGETIEELVPYCGNIFEQTVILPEVDAIKGILTDSGALTAVMTGSGSAVFGIFKSYSAADCCVTRLKAEGFFGTAAYPRNKGAIVI